ncbi:YhdP family protein [Herminiimonas sp. CN]|uniref:YhdP family protein n=1 Tax=Herminiimonas sp. CN TaxID=1349818 RepID=UPI000473D43A|nr:YhdP family protein [Herminiimonas sp. CN]
MSIDQSSPPGLRTRLSRRWWAARLAYAKFNALTHHALRWLVRLLVLAYFIFCGLFLTLRYAVLPNIDNYKGAIERLSSQMVGRPVTIARIYASWNGLQPYLSLNDVVLLDQDGRQALSLPSIAATFSWWSVAAGGVRLALLEINRPDLDIRRAADGTLFVGGIFIDTSKSTDNRVANWLLAQREIVVRQGRLRWNDQQRGAPELILANLNFRLRNQARHHQFGLQAVPPAALAAPIDVRADFVHPHFSRNISDVMRWKGGLFAYLPNADMAAWRAYADYPVEIMQGAGSVRAWLNFNQARVADFTADLRLSNVSARLRKDLQPLNLAQVSGRIFAREEFDPAAVNGHLVPGARGHTFSVSGFSLTTEDGLHMPPTSISESYLPGKNGKPDQTSVKAQRMDLQAVANFAERLPLTPAQLQMLADFAPRGELRDFSAEWQGTYPEIAAYAVKGKFAGLSLAAQPAREAKAKNATAPAQAAVPAIPGFENLTGQINASDKGGSFSLDANRLRLTLPGYFMEPVVAIDALKMQAGWSFPAKDQLLFRIDKMDLVQDGMVASLSGTHLMPLTPQSGKPLGEIDLTGQASGADVKKVGRYLPPQTPPHLRNWLVGALQGGRADEVTLRLKGDLAQMPFRVQPTGGKAAAPPAGIFRIAGKIRDGRLNFDPGFFGKDGKSPLWPELEQIQGSFVFENTRMEIRGDAAKTHGADLSNVKVVIADLLSHDSVLEIDGNAAGALQNYFDYVNNSPVAGWIDDFTAESKGGGSAKLALKLRLPLERLPESKVNGTLQLNNNDVSLQEAIPNLSAAKGKLEFNEKGLNLNGISANLLGGPAVASGGTQADGSIRIRIDGSVSAPGLRKAYPIPAVQSLTQRINGGTRYSSTVTVVNHQLELLVESGLQGLALSFPAPLQKAANAILPFKLQLGTLPSDDPLLLRDQIRVSLGSAFGAHYLRQKTVEKNARWRVARGGIGVNVPPPLPDSGLAANVELQSLNLDEWQRVSNEIGAADGNAAMPAQSGDALSISQYVEPESMAAHAKTLFVMGKRLDNVVVGASRQKNTWQANIDSTQASGYLTWDSTAGTMGRVSARLATLTIPQSDASDVENLFDDKNTPTQIPSLNIVAENFELFNRKLGRLEVVANNVKSQGVREWRINRLKIVNEDAGMTAAGKWIIRDGQSKTDMTYALDVVDAGKLLRRFGYPDVLRGGKGKLDGDINWTGLPFALDIPSLSGQIHLDMANGQFLKVDPGAAKLLGVLSMQSLPRRLTLDFRDIFSEGFSFDGVTASAAIERGVARTDNFKMRSVSAAVLIDGSADIARESQNLHVAVIPEINAGAASVVYALAVNPVIGLGTFLAQLFLREPLARAFTYEYQISGPWKDPVVTKIENKAKTSVGAPNK